MLDFVICIDDDWGPAGKELVTRYGGKLPVKGKVYTIREVVSVGSMSGYRLEEIVNPLVCRNYSSEPAFIADQFRPVKDSDLDIFREILKNVQNSQNVVRDGYAKSERKTNTGYRIGVDN